MADALALIAEMRGVIARRKEDGGGVEHLREQLAAQTDVVAALTEMCVDAEERARAAETRVEELEAAGTTSNKVKAELFELGRRIAQLEGECERLRTERDEYKEFYELGAFDRELLKYLREHERYTVERAVSDISGRFGSTRLSGMF